MKIIYDFSYYFNKLYENLTSEEAKLVNTFRSYKKTIANIIKNEHPSKDVVIQIRNDLNTYKQMIKNLGFSEKILKATTTEELTDILAKVAHITKVRKWLNDLPNIIRNDIKNNFEYFDTFSTILYSYDLYFDYKNSVAKKAILYKNAKDFLKYFEAHVEDLLKNSKSEILTKLQPYIDKGLEIEYYDDKCLIAWIYSETASIAVGSPQWCISYRPPRSTFWYDYPYKNDSLNKQYFIWNFTEDVSSTEYRFALTLSPNKTLLEFKDKSDNTPQLSFNQYFWAKYIKTLSPEQIYKWVVNAIKDPNEQKNINKNNNAAVKIFKSILNNNLTEFKTLISNKTLMRNYLINKEFKDIAKFIIAYSNEEFFKTLYDDSEYITGLIETFLFACRNKVIYALKILYTQFTAASIKMIKMMRSVPNISNEDVNEFLKCYDQYRK
jgi:hypothetical protein